MSIQHAFPYQEILKRLPVSKVMEANGYYKVIPHKAIRLFVNINNHNDQRGVFIFGEKNIINDLRKELPGYKEIYNFNDKEVHCLFLDESSSIFHKNIDRLIDWIKKSKKKN